MAGRPAGKDGNRGEAGGKAGVLSLLCGLEVIVELPMLDMLHRGKSEGECGVIVHRKRNGTCRFVIDDAA